MRTGIKEDPMATPRRSWIQFSLRSVLWLMLCIAVGFAAYWRGFDDGFADGTNSRHQVADPYLKAYSVRDLLPPLAANETQTRKDAEPLVQDIKRNVLPNTWKSGGAAIAFFGANSPLVISHDAEGHERIAEFLKRRRDRVSHLSVAK
jgi:hypothetical protein